MSRLEELNSEFRNQLIPKNTYNNNDTYTVSHPNALSDGDEFGKGEYNGSIGGKTDIDKRYTLLTKNIYSNENPYDSSKA